MRATLYAALAFSLPIAGLACLGRAGGLAPVPPPGPAGARGSAAASGEEPPGWTLVSHAAGSEAAAPAPSADHAPEKKNREKRDEPSVGGRTADPRATGAIQGRVILNGTVTPGLSLRLPPDHHDWPACGEEIPDDRVIVGTGSVLPSTVVSLLEVPGAPRPQKRIIILDNLRCRFVPRVQAATVGSTLRITNHDAGVLHSVVAAGNVTFNVTVQNDQTLERPLPRPGRIPIGCAVHSWMEAFIWVFPHDFFAVTSGEGRFRIEGIPPGTYQVRFWHEGPIREVTEETRVEAGKTAELNVEMQAIQG